MDQYFQQLQEQTPPTEYNIADTAISKKTSAFRSDFLVKKKMPNP